MSNLKKVSVLLASYNGEKYIEDQIISILKNLRDNDELIITDDGSTDSTINIINKYQKIDNRIVLLKGPSKGVKRNFEFGLKHIKGDYVFLSDQDDIWFDNKLEIVLELLNNYDLIIHNALFLSNDELNGTDFFSFRNCKSGFLNNLIKNRYIGCCMAFNSKLIKWILPFPNDIPMHDQWIGLVAEALNYKIYFYNKCLIHYRRHDNNISHFYLNPVNVMIKNRIYLLKHVIRRVKVKK